MRASGTTPTPQLMDPNNPWKWNCLESWSKYKYEVVR